CEGIVVETDRVGRHGKVHDRIEIVGRAERRREDEDIPAGAAFQRVDATTADKAISSRPAVKLVATAAAVEIVLSLVALEVVTALVSVDPVVGDSGISGVFSDEAVEEVRCGAVRSRDRVGAVQESREGMGRTVAADIAEHVFQADVEPADGVGRLLYDVAM